MTTTPSRGTSLAPWLDVPDGPLALGFYTAAFGAREVYRFVASGSFVVRLSVESGAKRERALVYVGNRRGKRRPMPGYQERLVAAAEDWHLPAFYVAALRRLAPGYRGARPAETGEIA